jgi:anti-sigma factor RsiW
MMASSSDDRDMKLQAYCDGALDPASALAFEREMATDASLKAQHDQIMALRQALRRIPEGDMPASLLARVTAAVDAASEPAIRQDLGQKTPRPMMRSWRAMAASALIGAVLAGSVSIGVQNYQARQDVARQVVASHIRALLAPQPFDVASSDRHTVKPWFTTHVPESPQVVDLGSKGFELLGGRVDVIGGVPVATIVYRRGNHDISLMALHSGMSVPVETISGFNVRTWSDEDFTYVAVSDVASEDLQTFETAFKAGEAPP